MSGGMSGETSVGVNAGKESAGKQAEGSTGSTGSTESTENSRGMGSTGSTANSRGMASTGSAGSDASAGGSSSAGPIERAPLVRRILRVGLTVYMRLYHHLELHGADRLPRRGPAIVLVNHASLLDV